MYNELFIHYELGTIKALNDFINTWSCDITAESGILVSDVNTIFGRVVNNSDTTDPIIKMSNCSRWVRLVNMCNDVFATSIGAVLRRRPDTWFENISRFTPIAVTTRNGVINIGGVYITPPYGNQVFDLMDLVNRCFADIFSYNGCNDNLCIVTDQLLDEFIQSDTVITDSYTAFNAGYDSTTNYLDATLS